VLQQYFIRPTTVDRIRASWIGDGIERYVTWMTERGNAPACVGTRVPILMQFGEFARQRGATDLSQLPQHIEPFIDGWVQKHRKRASREGRHIFARHLRNPIHQLLQLILPAFSGAEPALPDPFVDRAPGYFPYLRAERGLRDSTLVQHRHHLRRLETYLKRIELQTLSGLSPTVVSAFITEIGQHYRKPTVRGLCSVLKVFLSYLHREGLIARDLSAAVESPRHYRLSQIPRCISWDEVRMMLDVVDRRGPVGKRDYAILLLLVTYGLRAREIAALTLDNIDWKRERLHVPDRKAGHSTVFPLSSVVGNAVVDYLKGGRPKTSDRALFINAVAPHLPITWTTVSLRAKWYLRRAGIKVHRPGSHTLRHSCVQRLLDAHLSLKTIGDYIGHRSPDSTRVYTKIDIEALREMALGNGEAIL
jgi:integrase/recombinase XerD